MKQIQKRIIASKEHDFNHDFFNSYLNQISTFSTLKMSDTKSEFSLKSKFFCAVIDKKRVLNQPK